MKEFFLYIGIGGFLAVFQAIGCGLGLAAYWHWQDECKKNKKIPGKEVAGLVFGALFVSFFALSPLSIAYEYGGWIGLVYQVTVLMVIFTFICMSQNDRLPEAEQYQPEPEDLNKPIVPDIKQHFLRALPGSLICFFLSVAYGMVLFDNPFSGMDKDWLADLARIEMLVLHSLPFISLITLIRFEHKTWRIFQWFLFVTWYCLYIGFALDIRESIDALVAFIAATLGTYMGFMLQESDENRVVLVFKRWIVCLSLYVIIILLVGAEWRDTESMIRLGLVYFAVIGSVELTPIYRTHWRRWLDLYIGKLLEYLKSIMKK